MKKAKNNWLAPALVGGGGLLLIAITMVTAGLGLSPRSSAGNEPDQFLFLLLKELGWEPRALGPTPLPTGAICLIPDSSDLGEKAVQDLRSFAEKGGRLIVAAESSREPISGLSLVWDGEGPEPLIVRFGESLSSLVELPDREFVIGARGYATFGGSQDGEVLAWLDPAGAGEDSKEGEAASGDPDEAFLTNPYELDEAPLEPLSRRPYILRLAMGEGSCIVVSDPHMLSPAALMMGEGAVLVNALLVLEGEGIVYTEAGAAPAKGGGIGFMKLMASPEGAPIAVVALILLGLAMAAQALRFGAALPEAPPPARSLDFPLRAIGGFYRRAGAVHLVDGLLAKGFARRAAAMLRCGQGDLVSRAAAATGRDEGSLAGLLDQAALLDEKRLTEREGEREAVLAALEERKKGTR